MAPPGKFQRLARRQLSETLTRYAAAATPRPRDGWIAALRGALDMTVRQFAARLRITPSNALRLEQREREDTITLGALRRAAEALDSDLVYAIVPRLPLDGVLERRAREVAVQKLQGVAHSMALEDQAVRDVDLDAQIADLAAALVENPRRLWDIEPSPTKRQAAGRRYRPK